VMRLVILVLRGRPVIHRATALYVVFRILVVDGLPVHHAGEAQNIAGKMAVSARWCATCAGTPACNEPPPRGLRTGKPGKMYAAMIYIGRMRV